MKKSFEIRILPPSITKRREAIDYVKGLRRTRNQSDLHALRSAALTVFTITPIFFVLMTGAIIDFRISSILSGALLGCIGFYCIFVGYRLLRLFNLFSPMYLEYPPEHDH